MAITARQAGPAGRTCYFVVRNATGQFWNGSAYETLNTAHAANYKIAATESSGIFSATVPAGSLAAMKTIEMRLQFGASPLTCDPLVVPLRDKFQIRPIRDLSAYATVV